MVQTFKSPSFSNHFRGYLNIQIFWLLKTELLLPLLQSEWCQLRFYEELSLAPCGFLGAWAWPRSVCCTCLTFKVAFVRICFLGTGGRQGFLVSPERELWPGSCLCTTNKIQLSHSPCLRVCGEKWLLVVGGIKCQIYGGSPPAACSQINLTLYLPNGQRGNPVRRLVQIPNLESK